MDTHPEPANSSPRARPDPSDDTAAANSHPFASKLRLMCSYGGHIIPRPHDKSLCYVGGDTRIVVADRRSSLADLHSRLSQTLLNGRHFTLKYQLPAEDLDSLISLATDEDLENMIEEYDRTAAAASPLKPSSSSSSRIRLFLFPTNPETVASMGSLLDDAKSETWFVDALNGAGLLPRGLSESAAIDTLLELNRDSCCADLEAQNNDQLLSSSSLGNNDKHVTGKSGGAQLEVLLDSPPVMETSSSFGSSSSTPSMANLPPIKVRGGEGHMMMVGLDEQMSHVNVGAPSNSAGPQGENAGRVVCEDERSEKADGARKPPLPLQPVQRKLVDIQNNLASPDSKHAGPYSLPSPDSVACDCSLASAGSLSKHTNTTYQDTTQHTNNRDSTRANPTPLIDPNKVIIANIQETSSQVPLQPQPDPASLIPHPHQHQFINNHPQPPQNYIHQHSYYPMFVHPQTQQQPIQQHPNDQAYQMYLLPPGITQTQPCYDAPGRPLTPPPSSTVSSYTKEAAGPVTYVQVPANQYQQQYIGLSQIPNPAAPSNYGYEYSHHLMQDQMYYGRQVAAAAAAPPSSQYQTRSPAAAGMLSQASSQMPTDNGNQQS